jgi:hypothetical protein
MKTKCTRCKITCNHYNNKCLACGYSISNGIIELPGLIYAYIFQNEVHIITLHNPKSRHIEITGLRDSGNLLYHATFDTVLSVKYLSEYYNFLLSQGEHEQESIIYALQGN